MRHVGSNDNGQGGLEGRQILEFNQEQHCGLIRPFGIFTGSTTAICDSAAEAYRRVLPYYYHFNKSNKNTEPRAARRARIAVRAAMLCTGEARLWWNQTVFVSGYGIKDKACVRGVLY